MSLHCITITITITFRRITPGTRKVNVRQGDELINWNSHQPKTSGMRPTNCSATPGMAAKDNRWYIQVCAYQSACACKRYRWMIRSRSSCAAWPNDPKTEKPNWIESMQWEPQTIACLSRFPCSTAGEAKAASLHTLQGGDTPTRSTQHCITSRTWFISFNIIKA